MTRHGDTTILVRCPAGFDPETGTRKPPTERGFQISDIRNMRKAAEAEVVVAQAALAAAQARLASVDVLVADAEAVLPKAR